MLRHFITNAVYKRWCIFAAVFVLTCAVIGMQAVGPDNMASDVQPVSEATELGAMTAANARTVHASIVSTDLSLSMLGAEQFLVLEQGHLMAAELGAAAPLQAITEASVPLSSVPYVPQAHGTAVDRSFVFLDGIPFSRDLQQYTYQRCVDLGLEYELVLAIIWRESRFQTDAVNLNANGTYDNGLMQINDVNRGWLARDYGINDLLDPYQNIDAGTAMLAMYMNSYPETQALLAYQYGEGGMLERRAQGMSTNDLTVMVQQKRDEFRVMTQSA